MDHTEIAKNSIFVDKASKLRDLCQRTRIIISKVCHKILGLFLNSKKFLVPCSILISGKV